MRLHQTGGRTNSVATLTANIVAFNTPLVWHFVREFSGRHGRAIESIPSHTMKALTSYHWPGNIRELQNVIERSVIISKCPVLTVDFGELNFGNGNKCGEQNQGGLDDMLHEAERTEILRALELTRRTPATACRPW
jgi:formate hydrogenlyase transcriptional activator